MAGFCALIVLQSACTKEQPARQLQDSAAAASPQVSSPQASSSVDARCPATGLWAECSVEKRLKQSGLVPIRNDSAFPPRAGFSVKPAAFTLNRSRLELYLYPDAASLGKEILKVDTTAVAPVFIRSGNLAALLFTDDATQAERVTLALTAGAPQPGK